MNSRTKVQFANFLWGGSILGEFGNELREESLVCELWRLHIYEMLKTVDWVLLSLYFHFASRTVICPY